MSEPAPSKPNHWQRAVRPLVWWSIMVLLMFAYRTHERLSANTRISFDPTLAGNRISYEVVTTLDGKFANSGQRIPIGWHTLTITHPKTKPYSTNLFVWYGEHDLGQIVLERAIGTLVVNASPIAQRLTIRGPEFSTTLTNTSGMTSSVPTDRYVVEAAYKYWNRKDEVTVTEFTPTSARFAPLLGTLNISANHENVTYMLRDAQNVRVESGGLPAMVTRLPEGTYRLISRRNGDEQESLVTLKAGVTNEARVEFIYGSASFTTDPPGATIKRRGEVVGVTPATLNELKTGETEFTLHLDGYAESVSKVSVVASQTNSFQTNLVSLRYLSAMEQARRFFDDREYGEAANAAQEALKYKSGDEPATQLGREAAGMSHLNKGEILGQRGDYTEAIKEIQTALQLLNNNGHASSLLADFSKREQERIEVEKKRQAELVEQENQRRRAQAAVVIRETRLTVLQDIFGQWCRKLPNYQVYAEHELVSTNAVKDIATPINNVMGSESPKFEVIKYEWPIENTFVSVSSQSVAGGTRMCVIVASEVQTNETHIRFKVFEYDNPPDMKLLGGLIRVSAQITTTAPPSVAESYARAEKFAVRVKEGIKTVQDRIRVAAGIVVVTK